MSTSNDELHDLIDQLPAEELEEARRILESLLARAETSSGPRASWAGEELLRLAGTAEGPPDLARRHDTYADPQA